MESESGVLEYRSRTHLKLRKIEHENGLKMEPSFKIFNVNN